MNSRTFFTPPILAYAHIESVVHGTEMINTFWCISAKPTDMFTPIFMSVIEWVWSWHHGGFVQSKYFLVISLLY